MSKPVSHILDLSRLHAFVAVCEEKSVTAAAKRLGMTQPALSIALVKLESRLGTPLLLRERRGVNPTVAGARLLVHAYQILEAANSAVDEILHLTESPQGDVVIGLPSSTASVLAIPLVERLSTLYPGIRLRLVESFSGYLWKWLEEGTIDIAVVFDRQPTTEIECTMFAREQMYLMSKRTPRKPILGPVVTAEELAQFPLVMPSHGLSYRNTFDLYAERAGVSMNVALEIDAGAQLVKLVASGRLHSVLAPCAVADQLRIGLLTARPIEPALTRVVCLARRRLSREPTATSVVVEELLTLSRGLISHHIWDAELTEIDTLSA